MAGRHLDQAIMAGSVTAPFFRRPTQPVTNDAAGSEHIGLVMLQSLHHGLDFLGPFGRTDQ
jgi:hypothetical protein